MQTGERFAMLSFQPMFKAKATGARLLAVRDGCPDTHCKSRFRGCLVSEGGMLPFVEATIV
jgi:hypothetical protein